MRIASAAMILVAPTAVAGCADDADPCTQLRLDYFQAAADARAEANNLILGVVFQAGELDPALISDGKPINARGIEPNTEAAKALAALLADRELHKYINSFTTEHKYGHYLDGARCRPEPPQS